MSAGLGLTTGIPSEAASKAHKESAAMNLCEEATNRRTSRFILRISVPNPLLKLE